MNTWCSSTPPIPQSLFAESGITKILNPQTLPVELHNLLNHSNSESKKTLIGDSNSSILQTLSAILTPSTPASGIPPTSAKFDDGLKSKDLKIPQTVSVELKRPDFAIDLGTLLQKLTFSHFVELLPIDEPQQRAFYEIECVKNAWSVRELKRQIGSMLFERLGLSTDKDHALVEYALGGMDENLFVSAYKVALPSADELQRFLREQTAKF